MSAWQNYLAENRGRFLDELKDFLRIESVSALPKHKDDVEKAGNWAAERMRQAGIENVKMLPTDGHPVIYGDWLHAGNDKPTILIYGHFDVQPADPFELWETPPFEANIRDGRIYARGANDDKGNMLLPIFAFEALRQTEDGAPINLKFFFEGQEEIGSPDLPKFVATHRELLHCDYVISADGGQFSETEGNIFIGMKGLCALEVSLKGANADLHSGMHGGAVQNPLFALAHVLASIKSLGGKILVDGFYDNVAALSDEDRKHIADVPFDEAVYKESLGVNALFGEAGYSTIERTWARPTLEINGMWGGFQGEGVKTVLPNEAHAKISCRLVADQNPQQIIELLIKHIRENLPPGVTATFKPENSAGDPYLMPADHPGNQAAFEVLTELYVREPYYTRSGGTIPVTGIFLKELGVYTVNFAFALDDEKQHSPNEFFRLSSFDLGQKAYCKLLHRIASK